MQYKLVKLNIEIFLEPEMSEVAANIQPLYKENGILDSGAKADYDEFVMNVYALFDYYDFELLDLEESNRSSTSEYLTFYKKGESTASDIKCIIFIRISDHDLNNETKSQRQRYYEKKAEEYKQPKSKKHQRWKFKSIVVNNTYFDSYDEALDAVERKLQQL